MAIKEKDKSLLEIAIGLIQKKRNPCKLNKIIEEVMEIKGYKGAKAKEHTPQFLLDFMQSGYFVYCGGECWDLKERQSTSVIDKEGADYEKRYNDDEEVKKYELKDDTTHDYNYDESDDDNDEDNDNDIDDEFDEDDLSKEFENVSYDEEDEDEDDEE